MFAELAATYIPSNALIFGPLSPASHPHWSDPSLIFQMQGVKIGTKSVGTLFVISCIVISDSIKLVPSTEIISEVLRYSRIDPPSCSAAFNPLTPLFAIVNRSIQQTAFGQPVS